MLFSPFAVYSLSLNPTSGASGSTFTATYSADDCTTRILTFYLFYCLC